MPHKNDFDLWMGNLNTVDYNAICNELNSRFDGSEVNTSSWIPGNNWTGTVYEPVYHACGDNKELSGLFFGLILFDLLMNRQDNVWGFKKSEEDQIKGKIYFIIKNPPPYK